MKIFIITIFPDISKCMDFGTLRIAKDKGLVEIVPINPRDFASDKHKSVDDEPYGGGAGMVMMPGPLVSAIKYAKELVPSSKAYLLSPDGVVFTQKMAFEMANEENLIFICGRYEGVDERVKEFVDRVISIGDFVLSGGEFASLAIIEAVVRLIPGVLGSKESLEEESFSNGLFS